MCVKNFTISSDLIWHYTSPSVFSEFMKDNSCLYATHYKFLNDSTEVEYGINFALDELANYSDLRQYREPVFAELKTSDFFLTCFSHDPDNLYQWRSYTPYGGYSIGFSRSELGRIEMDGFSSEIERYGTETVPKYLKENNILSQKKGNIIVVPGLPGFPSYNNGFVECLYQKELQINKLQIEFNDFLLHEMKTEKYKEIQEDILRKFYVLQLKNKITFAAMQYKNPSFYFEREVRLVYMGDSLRKRIQYIGNKPRIPTFIRNVRNLIRGVYISPHGDKLQNRLLAELFRDKFNLSFDIIESSSSYNGK